MLCRSMATFSLDLRERIVSAYDKGEGTRDEIAQTLWGLAWHG